MTLESEALTRREPDENPRVLVIACGALARELVDVIKGNGLAWVDVECLPAKLHNTPDQITAAVERKLDAAAGPLSEGIRRLRRLRHRRHTRRDAGPSWS